MSLAEPLLLASPLFSTMNSLTIPWTYGLIKASLLTWGGFVWQYYEQSYRVS